MMPDYIGRSEARRNSQQARSTVRALVHVIVCGILLGN